MAQCLIEARALLIELGKALAKPATERALPRREEDEATQDARADSIAEDEPRKRFAWSRSDEAGNCTWYRYGRIAK